MSPAAAVAAMKTVPILPGMRMTPSCGMTMAVTMPCTMTVTAAATAPAMRMPVREPAFPACGTCPLFHGQRELFQQTRQLHLLLTGKPFQQLPGFLTTVPADEIRQLAPFSVRKTFTERLSASLTRFSTSSSAASRSISSLADGARIPSSSASSP